MCKKKSFVFEKKTIPTGKNVLWICCISSIKLEFFIYIYIRVCVDQLITIENNPFQKNKIRVIIRFYLLFFSLKKSSHQFEVVFFFFFTFITFQYQHYSPVYIFSCHFLFHCLHFSVLFHCKLISCFFFFSFCLPASLFCL